VLLFDAQTFDQRLWSLADKCYLGILGSTTSHITRWGYIAACLKKHMYMCKINVFFSIL